MSNRTIIPDAKPEGASLVLGCTVTEADGVTPIPDTSLTTLTLTLYDKRSGAIINSRNAVDILNAGIGTVDASGAVLVALTPADGVFQSQTLRRETHIALIEWTWASGTKAGKHEVHFVLENLLKVT